MLFRFHFGCSGRGRGSYRSRGRGNYYRQPTNQAHQPPGAQLPHSNMPYYDPSMNMMNPSAGGGGSGSGSGPYRDNSYQDIQQNRYETFTPFDTQSIRERLTLFMIEQMLESKLIAMSHMSTTRVFYQYFLHHTFLLL